ncbi:uncharacterized protein KIAA2012 homolog isoform X3 [Lepisosteus oculatus]|uniref:uncharacterized protein KIAA2012 homolog isoform X3 n=1 Tax=Lepisosteus oculatus TaxID=7918 RepID=UPI0035F51F85
MKDSALSLLSRGCGHLVKKEEHSTDGKLEVYFEPKDYFNWKSQQAGFDLSKTEKGHEAPYKAEPAPPKTYSTRKGPLILYSEDMALSSWDTGRPGRKRKGNHRYRQEVELQLRTLRDLTGAILAYGNKQEGPGDAQPLAHFLGNPQEEQMDGQIWPGYCAKRCLAHLSHTWHPNANFSSAGQLPGGTLDPSGVPDNPPSSPSLYRNECDLTNEPRLSNVFQDSLPHVPEVGECRIDMPDKETNGPFRDKQNVDTKQLEDQKAGRKRRKRCSIMPEAPRAGLSPVPEMELPFLEENTGDTGGLKETLVCGAPQPWDGVFEEMQNEAPKKEVTVTCSMKTTSIDSSQLHSQRSYITYYGGTLAGGKKSSVSKSSRNDQRDRQDKTLLDPSSLDLPFPPIPTGMVSMLHPMNETAETESDRLVEEGAELLTLPALFVPESTRKSNRKKCPEKDFPKEMLILPMLFPGDAAKGYGQKSEDVSHHAEPSQMKVDLHGSPEQEVEKRYEGASAEEMPRALPVLRPREVELEWSGQRHTADRTELKEDNQDDCFTAGVLPPIIGKKGPGRQSSMAYFRDPSKDQKDSQTGIIRGSIPEVLRESYRGSSVGCLIMAPDGEIMRLSLWGPITENGEDLLFDDITQNEALQILSSDVIVEQPWKIFLQPEMPTVGLDTDSDFLTRQSQDMSTYLNKSDKIEAGENGHEGHKKSGERSNPDTSDRVDRVLIKDKESNRNFRKNKLVNHEWANQHLQKPGKMKPHEYWDSKGNNEASLKTAGKILPTEGIASTTQTRRVGDPLQKAKKHPDDATCSSPGGQRSGEGFDSEGERGLHSGRGGVSEGSLQFKGGSDHPWCSEATHPHLPVSSSGTGHAAMGFPQSQAQLEPSATAGSTSLVGWQQHKTEETYLTHSKDSLGNRVKAAKGSGNGPMTEEEEEEFLSTLAKQGADLKTEKSMKTGRVKEGKQKDSKANSGVSVDKKKVKGKGQQGRAEFVVGKPREKPVEEKADKRAASLKRKPQAAAPEIVVEAEVERQTQGTADVSTDGEDVPDEQRPGTSETHWSFVMADSDRGSVTSRLNEDPTLLSPRTASKALLSTGITEAPPNSVSLDGSDMNSSTQGASLGSGRREQHRADKAEQRRLEVERKRREKEVERKQQQEKEEREERMKQELEEQQQRRAQEIRLKRQREEEERQRQEEEVQSRLRTEQAQRERERRRQEELRHRLQQLNRRRLEEEAQRAVEAERRLREEEERRAEEHRQLLEMEEGERQEYLRRRKEEEEQRQRREEERRRQAEEQAKRALEEARWQAERLARQRAALEQQLRFRRDLLTEAEGLERMQDVSRPWVYSYFQLLQLLGFPADAPEEVSEEI